jgi:hypothetical protein
VPAIRYEILLPLKYNDGRDIEPGKLLLMFWICGKTQSRSKNSSESSKKFLKSVSNNSTFGSWLIQSA